MSNAFVIITDRNNELVYNGIQLDGGIAAIQLAKDNSYAIRLWDMGSNEHLYQLSNEVRGEIKAALKAVRSKKRKELSYKSFRVECYELYKLDWIASHGYTLEDTAKEILALVDEGVSTEEAFSEFEQNGYSPSGEIYACFEDFIENEYEDIEYMRQLLSEDMFKLYLRDDMKDC